MTGLVRLTSVALEDIVIDAFHFPARRRQGAESTLRRIFNARQGAALLLLTIAALFTASLSSAQTVSAPAQPSAKPGATEAATTPTATTAGARLSFGDAGNVVRINTSSADFVLSISGMEAAIDKLAGKALADHAATLTVSELGRLGGTSPVTVTPRNPRFIGRSPAGWSWLVTLEVNPVTAGWTERRLLRCLLGEPATQQQYAVEYTLTTVPPTSGQFDVLTPGHDWIVSLSAPDHERVYPVTLVNKSEPITGLTLAQTSLKRTDEGAAVGFNRVRLLGSPGDKDPGVINLKAHETKTVFLRLDSSSGVGPFGTFTGQVQLVSEGTAPKAVPLSAKVTSGGIKAVGVALVLVGLGLSLFIANRLRPTLLRLQALRPAAVLRDLLLQFADETTVRIADAGRGIAAQARRLAERLRPDALDAEGLLPAALSIAQSGVPESAALQRRLNEISAHLAGLIVLRDTIAQLEERHGHPAPVARAIEELDAFAPRAVNEAAAHAEVTRVLNALRTAMAAQGQVEGAGAQDQAPGPLTVSQVDFALQQTANLAAAIWAAVSFAIGATFVYSDVDFGTPTDLLGAFLWGLGVTAFGAGMQQLTPNSIATHIGVNVPRTGATP